MTLRGIGAVFVLLALAACSSGNHTNANAVTSASVNIGQRALFAQGPISRACLASDRRAATRAQCGCVQAVADLTLSESDQRKGAAFFADPHRAQVVRQSDNPANERFWQRWKAYGDQAAQLCT